MPKVTNDYINEKKKEILDATYKVCCRKPIINVEIKDIIEECGYSHGAIYRYYKSLEDIFRDLIISINQEYSLKEETDELFSKCDILSTQEIINQICHILSSQMQNIPIDILKITIYCHVMAMSEPQRANKITNDIHFENKSPLEYIILRLTEFLHSAKESNKIKNSKPIDEIIKFFIISYEGIIIGATFCEQNSLKSYTKNMFEMLATSLNSLIEKI